MKDSSGEDQSKTGQQASLRPAICSGWMMPETAPRDGTQILGDFGWPWPTMAAWDEYDGHWVVCNLQRCPMEDGADNTYFETDTESRDQLRRWMPLLSLPNDKRRNPEQPQETNESQD